MCRPRKFDKRESLACRTRNSCLRGSDLLRAAGIAIPMFIVTRAAEIPGLACPARKTVTTCRLGRYSVRRVRKCCSAPSAVMPQPCAITAALWQAPRQMPITARRYTPPVAAGRVISIYVCVQVSRRAIAASHTLLSQAGAGRAMCGRPRRRVGQPLADESIDAPNNDVVTTASDQLSRCRRGMGTCGGLMLILYPGTKAARSTERTEVTTRIAAERYTPCH